MLPVKLAAARAHTFTVAEIAVWAVAFAVSADFAHFTWWGLAVYAAFLVAHAAGASHRVVLLALLVQLVVIVGVVTMSIARCGMLRSVLADYGPAAYTLGNFFVHYAPTIGVLARYTKPTRPWLQSALAATLFAAYCTAKRPNSVYGCAIPYTAVVVGGTGMFACLTLIATAVRID